ncbi:MAG: S8 family serine peptidase [Akkermansiaceae bacterium]|nr:S8 family serine peptidase [Verrucomicrobiales bacterium]
MVRVFVFLICCLSVGLSTAFGASDSPTYVPGRILIKPKAGHDPEALNRFYTEAGLTVLRRFATGGVQLVRIGNDATVPNAIQACQSSGLVEFAEPDHFVKAAATIPNDPFFLDGTLWGLLNTGQNGGVAGADIHAPDGWDFQSSASNIIVAVLDTGVRLTHEDLVSNLWVNTNDNTHGYNAFDDSHNPTDNEGHGTLVAGILGAVGNNGVGITGVAWDVQLMIGKCLDTDGEGTDSSVIAALEFAQTNGARIINTSFSSAFFSEAVSNTIASLRDDGIIIVAASGDSLLESTDVDLMPTYPACYDLDNIVSVASTGNDDTLGYRSNYGVTNVDLAAPGDLMFSTCFMADNAYYPHTVQDPPLFGSSFATAHVSGALALILEKFPGEDYQTSLRRLLLAVDKVPALEGMCATGGRLNLVHAFSPPIRMKFMEATGETFSLRVETSPNRTCIIEASPDLLNWSAMGTNTTSIAGYFDFADTKVTNAPQQFYRALSIP